MTVHALALYGALLLCLLASPARTEGWTPALVPRPGMPPLFMAVDKDLQRAFLVRVPGGFGKLDVFKTMPCTTGVKSGDKLSEDDRKTPEGVYFLDGKITSDLDFDAFGNTAFPLNYPNPVDRIQGKTGNGIWIHGRGRQFGPRQTLGCVVLENDDVDSLDTHMRVHSTPVFIGERISWGNATWTGVPPEAALGVWAWAKGKERRENSFFELYDPVRYAKSSGAPFDTFRKNTLLEFSRSQWVDIRLDRIQVMEGPGYLVTTFAQRTLPDNTEEGLRRLYWMRTGELWKIVGEEWIGKKLGTPVEYAGVVEREIHAQQQKFQDAWEKKDLRSILRAYDRKAVRDRTEGLAAIEQAIQQEMDAGGPCPLTGPLTTAITKNGVEARFHPPSGASRRVLFLPGNFDTWLIVSESAE